MIDSPGHLGTWLRQRYPVDSVLAISFVWTCVERLLNSIPRLETICAALCTSACTDLYQVRSVIVTHVIDKDLKPTHFYWST